MSTFNKFCGIDVSKDTLDYCVLNAGAKQTPQFKSINNKLTDISDQFSCSDFKDTLFILEPTGNYSAKLLYQLSKMGRTVSLVNPLQSKSYMAAMGTTNKNDKQAAYALTLMGQGMPLRRYKTPTAEMQERKQKLSALRALEKQERMVKNQLHALEQLPFVSEQAKGAFEAVLNTIEEQLIPLKESLYDKSSDPDFEKKKEYATSVIGIGNKTAEAVLLVANGLDDFDSYDKLSRFFGITPRSHYSGSSVRRRGKITKYGSNEVRRLLYCCASSAIKHNKACRTLYLRLRNAGKPHKLAAVAVMHKLVKQLFACVKSETKFDNEYHLKKQTK